MLAAIDSRTNKIAWKKELSPDLGTNGPLTTAGALMFRGAAGGSFRAYDARTGDLLWEFQTGDRGARGPAMSYEVDGEQYVAVVTGAMLWAFKLNGTLPPRAALAAVAPAAPRVEETNHIDTATLVTSADRGVGRRYAMDEHAFNPTRARVKAGAWVTFVNNGQIAHTVIAQDGSWTTGALKVAESGQVKLDRPGTFRYSCKEHPWAVAELTVE